MICLTLMSECQLMENIYYISLLSIILKVSFWDVWCCQGDVLPSDVAPALQLDNRIEPQTSDSRMRTTPYATSDTDDEMDNTESVSEWELEQKVSKVSAGNNLQSVKKMILHCY